MQDGVQMLRLVVYSIARVAHGHCAVLVPGLECNRQRGSSECVWVAEAGAVAHERLQRGEVAVTRSSAERRGAVTVLRVDGHAKLAQELRWE